MNKPYPEDEEPKFGGKTDLLGAKFSAPDNDQTSNNCAKNAKAGWWYKERISDSMIILTPRLSGFEVLNDATLIFQNWFFSSLESRLFAEVFHYLNFAEENKYVLEK